MKIKINKQLILESKSRDIIRSIGAGVGAGVGTLGLLGTINDEGDYELRNDSLPQHNLAIGVTGAGLGAVTGGLLGSAIHDIGKTTVSPMLKKSPGASTLAGGVGGLGALGTTLYLADSYGDEEEKMDAEKTLFGHKWYTPEEVAKNRQKFDDNVPLIAGAAAIGGAITGRALSDVSKPFTRKYK